jgi:hypothetical protein
VRRSRTWRKITVEGDEFRWRYGRGTVEVRAGREVVLREADYILAGVSPDDFERGQWKRTSAGMVTPSMIREALLKKFWPAKWRDEVQARRPRIHLWAGSIGGGC